MAKKINLIESFQGASVEVLLTESLSGTIRVRHKVLLLDVETGNGRVYPKSVVERAVKEARESMDKHELLCTVSGHPVEVFCEPDKASHYIIDSWIEDGYLWAESVVMGDTPEGAKLLGLIKNGACIGVSVRGVGSVTANRVTEYTYYGFDYVGTPSTGLRVMPDIVEDESIRESCTDRVTSYIKENNLVPAGRVTNNKGKNRMANVTYADFQATLKECMDMVSASKGMPDIAARIAMAEARVNSCLSGLDYNSAPFGQLSISESLSKWQSIKEASSVVNTSAEDRATSFEPSVGGQTEPVENKNSAAMKASAKEAADAVEDASEQVRKLQDELADAKSMNESLRNTVARVNAIALRESSKIQSMNALYKTQAKQLKEARKLLKEAAGQINESKNALVESTKRGAKLTEGLIQVRRDSMSLMGRLKKVQESAKSAKLGGLGAARRRKKIAEARSKNDNYDAWQFAREMMGDDAFIGETFNMFNEDQLEAFLLALGREYFADGDETEAEFNALMSESQKRSPVQARRLGGNKAPTKSRLTNLLSENTKLKTKIGKLQEDYEDMDRVAKELEKRIDNESPLEYEATNVAVALELALEESVTDNHSLKAQVRQLKEELRKANAK